MTNTYARYYPPPHHHLLNKYKNVSLGIEATYGSHRPDFDAVMAVAVGYKTHQLIYFITSLLGTGFEGDIVLGMGTNMDIETREFLSFHAKRHHLVVYEIELDCCCPKRGKPCRAPKMFKSTDENGNITVLPDYRRHRLVAQLRFEYYWVWTTFYNPSSWILLTDVRDVYFQSDPFDMSRPKMMKRRKETVIHVYEDTKSIKENLPERRWIQNIYNQSVLEQIGHLPGLCSGTTFGGQPAIETYTRARVSEWDETNHANNIGMDQGRHIFLVYMNKLVGAPNITDVISYKLGTGEVNTVGVPLKQLKVPLDEWPGYDSRRQLILNNDGNPSPVVHMFDRHPFLREIIENRTRDELAKWRSGKPSLLRNQ